MSSESSAGGKVNRNQRRFDRSEIVYDAAAKRFCDQGYATTSLQEIADDVGILKSSLYYYFETKEDLLFAIIKRNHERIINGNFAWRGLRDKPLEALESFVQGHMRQFLANRTESEVFVRDFRSLSPERAAEIMKSQAGYDHDFRTLVEAAIEEGTVRPGVTPLYASRAVFGMANWIYYWYNPASKTSADEVVAELSEYAMASLLARPRGAPA